MIRRKEFHPLASYRQPNRAFFKKVIASAAVATAALASTAHLAAAVDNDERGEKTGGATTVYATGRNAFSFPAANLTDAERTRFVVGNSFFRRNWVEAPASTTARDGLGPHFIARSCGGCHVQDGRGAPPEFLKGSRNKLEQPVALLMRLSVPDAPDGGGPDRHQGVTFEPVYGEQFNNAAIQGVKPEGDVVIHYEAMRGRFADGERYALMKPHYSFRNLGYGPMARDVLVSPRIAPQIIGVGLLEAIPESEIIRNAEMQAQQPGPIKGQPNRVWDAFAERHVVGRFGWKANVGSIAHQTAGAFQGDIGITSSKFISETCTKTQLDCLAAPGGRGSKAASLGAITPNTTGKKEPEIDDKTFQEVVFYQATLAPPARRDVNDSTVLKGQALFSEAQCAACHRPSYITSEGPFPQFTSPALQGQKIFPYTDLLLHDMGKDLADGRPDFAANGQQWKTPPLWGIGLIRDVNGHQRLMHDGRARGVLEAILWHGGQAEASREQVLKFSRAEREALVKFVESL